MDPQPPLQGHCDSPTPSEREDLTVNQHQNTQSPEHGSEPETDDGAKSDGENPPRSGSRVGFSYPTTRLRCPRSTQYGRSDYEVPAFILAAERAARRREAEERAHVPPRLATSFVSASDRTRRRTHHCKRRRKRNRTQLHTHHHTHHHHFCGPMLKFDAIDPPKHSKDMSMESQYRHKQLWFQQQHLQASHDAQMSDEHRQTCSFDVNLTDDSSEETDQDQDGNDNDTSTDELLQETPAGRPSKIRLCVRYLRSLLKRLRRRP